MHINCQFRDPLGPAAADWNPERDLRGLSGWDTSSAPYTSSGVRSDASSNASSSSSVGVYGGEEGGGVGGGGLFGELAALVRSAKRGLLVVAGGGDSSDALAAASIARTLGRAWQDDPM